VKNHEATINSTREPAALRQLIREDRHDGNTSGLAPGCVQCNVAGLPAEHAADFLRFCQLNCGDRFEFVADKNCWAGPYPPTPQSTHWPHKRPTGRRRPARRVGAGEPGEYRHAPRLPLRG